MHFISDICMARWTAINYCDLFLASVYQTRQCIVCHPLSIILNSLLVEMLKPAYSLILLPCLSLHVDLASVMSTGGAKFFEFIANIWVQSLSECLINSKIYSLLQITLIHCLHF